MRGGISALCPERPCHAGAAATTARQRCCGIMLAALGAGARHHAVELSLLAGGALSGAYDHGGQCGLRSDEHTSELQSLMRISYAVFCLKKKRNLRIKTARKTAHQKPTINTRVLIISCPK